MSTTDFRIEISDLVVDYGEVRAVDGVSLSVARGELVTLLGLAAARRTQKGHQFAAPDFERNIIDRADLTVIDDEVGNLDAEVRIAQAGSPE